MSRALCVAKECYLKNACLCNWPFSRFEDSVSMDSQCIFSDFGLKKKKMRSTISMSVNYQQSHLSLLIRKAGAETLFGERGRVGAML